MMHLRYHMHVRCWREPHKEPKVLQGTKMNARCVDEEVRLSIYVIEVCDNHVECQGSPRLDNLEIIWTFG